MHALLLYGCFASSPWAAVKLTQLSSTCRQQRRLVTYLDKQNIHSHIRWN